MKLDPWKMPTKPDDQCSPQETKEWLAHYDATAEERKRQSANFERTAVISMGVALLAPFLMFMAASIASKFFH
jgi:hypothetical protein